MALPTALAPKAPAPQAPAPKAPPPGIIPSEKLDAVRKEAEGLMQKHLGDMDPPWTFRFDRAVRRAGSCRLRKKHITITIAREFALKAPEAAVTDTILHEIAHALAGPRHGHDHVWQAIAKSIGCSGERCHDIEFAPPKWYVHCPKCGGDSYRMNRLPSRRRYFCTNCRTRVVCQPISPEQLASEAWRRENRKAPPKPRKAPDAAGKENPGPPPVP